MAVRRKGVQPQAARLQVEVSLEAAVARPTTKARRQGPNLALVVALHFSFSLNSFPPDGLAKESAVQYADDPKQAYRNSDQHHNHAAAHARRRAEAPHGNQET